MSALGKVPSVLVGFLHDVGWRKYINIEIPVVALSKGLLFHFSRVLGGNRLVRGW